MKKSRIKEYFLLEEFGDKSHNINVKFDARFHSLLVVLGGGK